MTFDLHSFPASCPTVRSTREYVDSAFGVYALGATASRAREDGPRYV
jgi:hypothetical protein